MDFSENCDASLNFFVISLISAGVRDKSVGASLTTADTDYDRLTQDNLNTILSYGDNLMEVVCRDVCDGHDVGGVSFVFCYDFFRLFDFY